MKRLFAASYVVGDSRYASSFYARDASDADSVARRRGAGETVDGVFAEGTPKDVLLSELIADAPDDVRKMPRDLAGAIVHAAAHLGHFALASKSASIVEVLGDRGFVHEIAHWIAGDPETDKAACLALARAIERAVPGWLEG